MKPYLSLSHFPSAMPGTWQRNVLVAAKQKSMYSGNADLLGYQPDNGQRVANIPSPNHTLLLLSPLPLVSQPLLSCTFKFPRKKSEVCVKKI